MSFVPQAYANATTPYYIPAGATGAGGTLSLSGDVISLSNGGGSVNVATATTVADVADKTTAQSYVSGFDSTRFTGEIIAGGNIESAPLIGGSVVLAGGLSEVQIGDASGQNPKVRFRVADMSDGVIEYTGMTFTFDPPLTDSDFQTLSIIGDQLSISGGNTVTLPATAPAGVSGNIQFNDEGAFGGDAGLTYQPSGRIVQLFQQDDDSRIEVIDTTTGNKTEIKSRQLNLVAAGTDVIRMIANAESSSIEVRRADNASASFMNTNQVSVAQSGVFQGTIVNGGFTSSDNITGAQCFINAVGTPACRVATSALDTLQYASSFDFREGGVLKAGLAYAPVSGAVGLTSANSGEVFLSRTDGTTEESIFGLQADNTYSFGNGSTADDCVLRMQKDASSATITFDGSGFVFSPALPAPPATAPAGSNTQLQYNNAGAFGASANLTFDGSQLQVVGVIDISGAAPQLNMADASGNGFTVELGIAPQPQVSFVGQAGAGMDMTPESLVMTASGGINSVDINAVNPSVAVSDGTATATLGAGYATASLPPTADDQLTRKDYVDAAVAGASGATPYIIYCSATAAPGGNGSFSLPYNSITDAITAAVAGSVIYLSGTFAVVQTTISKSNFTLKALGQAVIEYSSGAIPVTPYRGFWGMATGTSNVTFDGITFSSTIQPAAELNLLSVAGTNHVVRNCVFAGAASYDAFNPGAITTRGLQMVAGVANVLVEDCEIYNLRQPIYTNNGSGAFLRNSITNTRGAVNSTAGNFFQYTANVFGTNVLDIVVLSGVQAGAPYGDLFQLSQDNNFAVVQDQRVTPNITLQATVPLNVSYNTAFPLGTTAQPYFSYFLNSGLGGSIALPSTTNANGQYISFNNVPQLPNAGTLTITSSSANIYDGGTLNTSIVLAAGQQRKLVYSSAASAWLPVL